MSKILLTGGLGYIGTELTRFLIKQGHEVLVLDSCYFERNLYDEKLPNVLIRSDIRAISQKDFQNIDYAVHLAALSNDPLGEINTQLTYQINRDAAIKTAELAKKSGTKRFIFVSTQSIYGISNSLKPLNEDDAKSPVTAYAKAKWEAEQKIIQMNSKNFCVVAIRPSTVFGWGSRIRNDIIFNNMIMSGLKTGEIQVHTDGTPFRPVIHILDLIRVIYNLLNANPTNIAGEAFNVGLWNGNYSVREIANQASRCLGGIPIRLETENISDSRSYLVNFQKIYDSIGFKANTSLYDGGMEIVKKFGLLNTVQKTKYFTETIRLKTLKGLMESGQIKSDLTWV